MRTEKVNFYSEGIKLAGVLYLFDAKTKRPLHQVNVANSDREIEMVIELARKEATAP